MAHLIERIRQAGQVVSDQGYILGEVVERLDGMRHAYFNADPLDQRGKGGRSSNPADWEFGREIERPQTKIEDRFERLGQTTTDERVMNNTWTSSFSFWTTTTTRTPGGGQNTSWTSSWTKPAVPVVAKPRLAPLQPLRPKQFNKHMPRPNSKQRIKQKANPYAQESLMTLGDPEGMGMVEHLPNAVPVTAASGQFSSAEVMDNPGGKRRACGFGRVQT